LARLLGQHDLDLQLSEIARINIDVLNAKACLFFKSSSSNRIFLNCILDLLEVALLGASKIGP
jgi:hypothetical protein